MTNSLAALACARPLRFDRRGHVRAGIGACFIALLALVWLLPGQFGREPWKADEGYSFGIVLSMLADGHWVIPTLAGEAFMEKPPLMYWLAALFAWGFSGVLQLHEGARLANVACAVVAFAFTGIAAREIGARDQAIRSVLLLSICPSWLFASRFLIADVSLVAAQTVAAYGLMRLLRRGDALGALWLAVGIGAGFMSKGLISVGANGLAVLALTIDPRFRAVLTRRNLATFFCAIAPWIVVWPTMVAITSPELFLTWFWDNNFGRYLGLNMLGPANSGRDLLEASLVLLPVLPLAVLALAQRRHRVLLLPERGLIAMLVAWALVLATSAQLRSVYMLPLLIPLALLGAAARVPAAPPGRFRALCTPAVAILALTAMLALKYVPDAIAQDNLRALAGGPTQYWVLAMACALVTVYLIARRFGSAWAGARAGTWSLIVALIWATFVGLFLGGLDHTNGFSVPFRALALLIPRDSDCVASVDLGESERALLQYYAGIKTVRVESDPIAAWTCTYVLRQRRLGVQPASEPGMDGPLLGTVARAGDANLSFEALLREFGNIAQVIE